MGKGRRPLVPPYCDMESKTNQGGRGWNELEFAFWFIIPCSPSGLRVIMKDFIISFVHLVLMLWLSFILPKQEDLREPAKNELMNVGLDMNW